MRASGPNQQQRLREAWLAFILWFLSVRTLLDKSSDLLGLLSKDDETPSFGTRPDDLTGKQTGGGAATTSDHHERKGAMTRMSQQPLPSRCAINLYGLPRAFESLVLPSFVKHVVRENLGCDYFIHFYNVSVEAPSRSGFGGAIEPSKVYLLEQAVRKEARRRVGANVTLPIVKFVSDSDESLEEKRHDVLKQLRTVKDGTINEKLRYVPLGFSLESAENIIKGWHSIQTAWELMESHAQTCNFTYDRVAMLRSDVFFASPIRVWEADNGKLDQRNEFVVIPGFGKHPVSDRMIIGPYEAVKVWATQRFSQIERHMASIDQLDPGQGLHSERFVNYTVLPMIRALPSVSAVIEHSSICFVRARADQTLWITDCSEVMHNLRVLVRRVERTLDRFCNRTILRVRQITSEAKGRSQISCPKDYVHDPIDNHLRYVNVDYRAMTAL